MLKLSMAFVAVCALCTARGGEPIPTRKAATPAVPAVPAVPPAPPPPPPPPPMPTASDCWRDLFVNIAACQHDFEGTDRIVVAQRRTALSGAGNAFNSCLNIVPAGSPVTETPEVPAGARPWTCLEQLALDIKECRTKFSPGVPLLQGDPDRDTMKNAFDQCLGGAASKNGWCNGRKPNNPVAQGGAMKIDILEGPALASTRETVTLTVNHTGGGGKPVDIYWYAAVFNSKSELVSQQRIGMTPNVPATPTEITLPLTGISADGVDVVVLARAVTAGDEVGSNTGSLARAE